MRAQWHALHADLVRTSTRLSFQTDFQAMRGRHEALHAICDPADLLDRLHTPAAEQGHARNAILRALVVEAQLRDRTQTAVVLLMLALWPGLDAVYRRLLRHFRREPELLASEIAARVTQGIRGMSLQRVTWVAAALIRNTERDIGRSLSARWREEALRDEWSDEDGAVAALESSVIRFARPSDTDQQVSTVAAYLRRLIGSDADLVTAIAICDEPQNEAAQRFGISHASARKRYQRALARLRDHLAEDLRPLSHTSHQDGFSVPKAPRRSAPARTAVAP